MRTSLQEEAAFLAVMAHRTMLKAYVKAIVHEPTLAEDTFSDVTLEIVRSWDHYDQTKPFAPWARALARRVSILNLRRKEEERCFIDESTLEEIAQEMDLMGEETALDERKAVLRQCVDKLSTGNQQLIRLFYFENYTYQQMSPIVKRTVGALYIIFSRLHQVLGKCVQNEFRSYETEL